MKSYLARLVARVVPPVENLPVSPEPISDPFADAAGARADPSIVSPATPNAPAPPQISREDSPFRPLPSASALPDRAATDSEASVIRAEPTLVPWPREPSSTPHSRPDSDVKSRDNADKAKAKESAPLKPRDDDLLRVADGFMEKLQTHPREAPEAATLKPTEDPLPLLPREPPWNKTQSYRTQRVDPSAPSLHIGNLHVDIIESNAASVGPARSSAPKFIVRNGASASRSGATFRQRFGLRQL